jgi:hypothetical protein
MVLEKYLEKYEEKEDDFSVLSRYSKEVHDFRVKLLLLETEHRKFDTEVKAELKDLKAKVQGKEPEIEKLVEDIVSYTSSLYAVEKLIRTTVWLGKGLDEKRGMFTTLLQKLKDKKQRDEEQAAEKILKELEDGLRDDPNKILDDFEKLIQDTVWLGNGLDEKGETFMTLLQKLKEKKQWDEEQAAKKIIVKEIENGLGDDADKPLDDFELEDAGWTTVTSKRQRRRR